MAFSPITRPGRIVVPAPMEAPLHTFVLRSFHSLFFDLGYMSLVKVVLAPTITPSSNSIPSHICTPHLTVTLLPITTSFSIKQWEQILQFSPILAPGNTTQNCQILVDSGMAELLQSLNGCIIVLFL